MDYGDIKYDISVGGSFYIYTDIQQFGLDLVTSPADDIKATAHKMMKAVGDTIQMTHPVDDRPAVIGGVYFFSGPLASLPDSINEICIFFETVSAIFIKLMSESQKLYHLKQLKHCVCECGKCSTT